MPQCSEDNGIDQLSLKFEPLNHWFPSRIAVPLESIRRSDLFSDTLGDGAYWTWGIFCKPPLVFERKLNSIKWKQELCPSAAQQSLIAEQFVDSDAYMTSGWNASFESLAGTSNEKRKKRVRTMFCNCRRRLKSQVLNPLQSSSRSFFVRSFRVGLRDYHDGRCLKIKNRLKIYNNVTAWTVRQHGLVLKFLINEIFFPTTCKIFTRNPYGTTAVWPSRF